jgi:hypothetical protein
VRPFTLFDVSTPKNNEQQNSQEQQKNKEEQAVKMMRHKG